MGAAAHTTVIPPPRESAASQYRVGLIRFAPGRVLVFHGGVFECSNRMTGNLHVRFLEGWASAMAPGYSTKLVPIPTFPVSANRDLTLMSQQISDPCHESFRGV